MAEYSISAFLTCRKAKTSERIDNTADVCYNEYMNQVKE